MPDDSRTRSESGPDTGQRDPDGGLTDLIHSDRAVAQPVAGILKCKGDDIGHGDLEIEQGADVLCVAGEKIGEVVDVAGDHVVVERGFFIPRDIYVPRNAITGHDAAGLRLDLTKQQLEAQDWSEEPEGDEGPEDDSSD